MEEILARYPHAIIVAERQRGNPILKHVKNVALEYFSSSSSSNNNIHNSLTHSSSEMKVDFLINFTTCVYYLSIKYHNLHPTYLFTRLRELGKSYTTRILILHVDMDDNIQALEEINKICFMNNLTLLLAWSSFEVARYLESIKALEKKGATSIKGKIDNDFIPTINSCLTSIKSVNKTDVLTLLEAFKDFKGITKAKEELLLLCPGIGETKVKALYKAFHTSFI